MALPRWLAQINKRTFNKRELKKGRRPVLTHIGRTSGRSYRTPLDAHPVDGGWLFIPMYGQRSDWVRNILAAGQARLKVGDDDFDLVAPRLIDRSEAESLLELPGSARKVTEFLRMDLPTTDPTQRDEHR